MARIILLAGSFDHYRAGKVTGIGRREQRLKSKFTRLKPGITQKLESQSLILMIIKM
jgi:hypothetical protein